MSYDKEHKESECDRCLKDVGSENLHKIPFLYLDKNDNVHKDMSPMLRLATGRKCDDGYRQYFVCKEDYDIQMKMMGR